MTGTRDAPLNAFGVHFNPDVPSLDPGSILAFIRAFSLLHALLEEEGDVNLARRISPHVEPFPRSYRDRILAPDYAPDQATLIDDYLRYNPTRHRALDMRPLFAFLDEERVRSVVDDPRIKKRPTFHFRLPNARVSEARWKLTDEWQLWLRVEHLAGEPELMAELAAAYRERRGRLTGSSASAWTEHVRSRPARSACAGR